MSPINFPDSPTPGDVFRDFDTGYKYEYDGVVWKSYVDGSSSSIKVIDDVSSLFDSFQRTFELRVGGTLFYPISAQHIRVALNGELQTPYTDYTVSGAQITFDVPPTPGTEFSVVNLLVTAESPYTESYLTNLDVENKVTALSGVVTTILGTNIEYVGVGSFGTVAIGETVVINSDQGLENILSIDPTTSQTIYDSLLVSPTENFPNINVAGVSTIGFTSTSGLFVASNTTTPTVEITQNGTGDAAIIYGNVGINTTVPNNNVTIYGSANVVDKNDLSPDFESETIIRSYNIEVGRYKSGINTSRTFIDLHGGSPDFLNYSTRLLRNVGRDGTFELLHRGLGDIEIKGQDGAGFKVESNGSLRFDIDGGTGNIGINTTDASEKLVVVGNAIVSDRVSIGSTLKVLEDAWVRNTLSVGSSDVSGSVPTDEGVISAVGNGKNVIIIQADENTGDRGLAFRNEFDRYTAYINLAPNDTPDQGDLVFGHATTNIVGVDNVPEVMRLSNGGVGIGTTIPRTKLDIGGDVHVENQIHLGGVVETANTAVTYLDSNGIKVLELDLQKATTFTYTGTSDNIGIVSFKNLDTTKQSGTTATLLHTQGSLSVTGTGNTDAVTGMGVTVSILPSSGGIQYSGISPLNSLVGSGQTVTCSGTPGDIDFISFFVHYNGGNRAQASSYKVFITKNGDFR